MDTERKKFFRKRLFYTIRQQKAPGQRGIFPFCVRVFYFIRFRWEVRRVFR